MKQKFLVINCDENDVEELRQRLGGRQVVSCESIDEIARYLPSSSTAVLVSSHPGPTSADSLPAARSQMDRARDVDELVERVLEQSNGHAKTLAARVDMLEQKIIEYSLIRNGQHRKETAAELGISRVTLYNKMKKFGLLD
jgi:DNA-binding NtrC family response regulator